ncbi:MAG: hypothetical protein KC503_18260 [Myxococcales bacterium]|nr:hypothetical protein [Myxococcales bacterium]
MITAACGGAAQKSSPQAALKRYIAAIDRDDAKTAYDLLSESVRRGITRSEFVDRWKKLKPELVTQAKQLAARLEQPLDVTARVSYPGGTRARLRYADNNWRIDGGISVAFQTATPMDAIKAFVRAVQQRSYEAVMKLLARSVRKGIEQDIQERMSKIQRWIKNENEIEVTGQRARVRYDARYKLELVKEDGQWKILDFD